VGEDKGTWIWLAVVVAVLLLRGRGCELPPSVPTNPPLIVMLYEADHGELPDYATGAGHELVAAGREVRPIDDDDTNGLDETPAWLKPALEPGRKIMGADQLDDALILLDGETVIKAIKLPDSKEAILEAVK
jgi:hypothetical protein